MNCFQMDRSSKVCLFNTKVYLNNICVGFILFPFLLIMSAHLSVVALYVRHQSIVNFVSSPSESPQTR